jgi:ankyrin repeat protein
MHVYVVVIYYIWQFKNCHSEKVLLQLLKAFSNAVTEKDNYGNYPLHSACIYSQSENIIFQLLNAYPHAVTVQSNGYYPLHLVIKNSHSEKVVLQLLKSFPHAATMKCKAPYPLHLALIKDHSENVVLQLLNAYPQAASIYPQLDSTKYLKTYPLHLKMESRRKERRKLILFPHAVTMNNHYPLHLAIKARQSEKVVLQLLDVLPNAAAINNNYYFIALVAAILYGQSGNVVLALIDTNLLSIKDIYAFQSFYWDTRLDQVETIMKVLETISAMSKYELENRINIPMPVMINGCSNRRRVDIYQWLSNNISKK